MSDIKTFDCEGCHSFCYGGYHMEECKDGYGDWVRKEDHEAAVKAARKQSLEEAALLMNPYGDEGTLGARYAARIRALANQ